MDTNAHIDIGSSRLGYRRVGDGPDLLFIHGWPLHRETWRDVVPHLDGFRCHLLDLPGCGRSITPASTPVSLRDHVTAVVDAIEALGLDEVVLVGQDSGGLIARFAADQRIDQTPALVLAGTEIPHHHPPQIDRLRKAAKLPGAATVTQKMVNTPAVARSNQLFGGCFHDRDLIEGDFRTEVLDLHFRDSAAVLRQQEILLSYTTDLVDEVEEVHARLTCPTLLIWGDDDPFFAVEDARTMTDQFAGPTQFEVVERARLLVHEEHPQAFAELMTAFLTDLPSASLRG